MAGKKKLKLVIDPTLAKALSHSLRSHILVTLGDGAASPNEIATKTGLDVKEVSYHIRALKKKKLIRLTETMRRRGAEEHFYELTAPVIYLDDREWKRVPGQIGASFSTSLLRIAMDEALAALEAGTFDARSRHLSRTTMRVDEQGWREMMGAMNETLERALEIRRASARRLEKAPEQGTPVTVFMTGFEMAPGTVREDSGDGGKGRN